MTEIPKKPNIPGIDISKLSKVRPTKVPSALVMGALRPPRTNYKKLAIHAGILCLIILVAYGVSIINGFVFNDHYIDNFLGIKLSEASFWSNLIVRTISRPLSQPWIIASFAYDLQNFATDASWYHIVNLILHFLSCFYFYLFVYTLARYFWQDDGENEPVHEVALLSAALFACHPLGSEAVVHIVGRQASLLACNFFLSLDFFLWAFLTTNIKKMLRNYLLTFFFLIQAVFCGIQALAIPVVMLLLAILLKPINVSFISWTKHKWGEFLVILFLFVALPSIALLGFSADFSNGFVLPLQSWQIYVASQFRCLLTYYLRCFLFPFGLSVFPPYSIAHGLSDLLSIIGALVLAAAAYSIYKFKSRPLAAIGLGIAVFTYLPQIFFVQNEIAADWRFYLSIAGLSLFIASWFKPWLFDWQSNRKIKVVLCVLLGFFITVSLLRSLDFRSDATLFKSAVKVNQNDVWAKGMFALALVKEKKFDQGVQLAKKAIEMNNDCQPAYAALGKAYTPMSKNNLQNSFKYKEAKKYYERALALAKSQHLNILVLFEAERDLAYTLAELGEYKKAKEIVEQALLINPDSILLNLTMGKVCNASGDYLNALIHLNKVYEHDRLNSDFVEPLIEAELGIGAPHLINAAYNTAKMAIAVCPTHKVHIFLAQAALATGNLNESLQWSKAALKECPNDPLALYMQSFVLKASGQHKMAAELKARALAADPDVSKKIKMVVLNKERNSVIPFNELYPLAGR